MKASETAAGRARVSEEMRLQRFLRAVTSMLQSLFRKEQLTFRRNLQALACQPH
jgi:hypothetical protein